MGEGEAADDQTPFFQTQPAEHPLKITGLVSVHPFINPSFVLFSINVDYHKVRASKEQRFKGLNFSFLFIFASQDYQNYLKLQIQ